MGKRQIGEMQPYEVVITLIIADLATLPMSDTNIPLLHGILPLAILVLLHYFITLLTRKSIKIRRLVSGQPVVVISPNGIEYQALKSLNITIDDLCEMLRQGGYYSLEQVHFAIIETNGKMSVVPKSANAPATAQDVSANNPEPQIPSILINDGKMMKKQMKEVRIDTNQLYKILTHLKINSVKDVIILSLDADGKLFYQTKTNPAQIIQNINKELNQWNYGFQC